jgi:hypothetical protein
MGSKIKKNALFRPQINAFAAPNIENKKTIWHTTLIEG